MWSIEDITERDRKFTSWIVKMHNSWLTPIMKFFTYAGVGGLIWFCTVGIPTLFFKETRVTGILVIIALGVNYILSEVVIKKIVRRNRPSKFIDDNDMLINKPKDPSFPSGHSSSSFAAVAVTFLTLPWFFYLPAFVVASIIAFSRVYLRVHYLSDVICGAVFGFMVGCTVVALYVKFFMI